MITDAYRKIVNVLPDPIIVSIDFVAEGDVPTLPTIYVTFDQNMDPACITAPNLDLTFVDAIEPAPP
jgi:hypothetical protein